MEQIPHSPPSVSGGHRPQLADGRHKVERIAEQSRALIDDVKEWVELKIQYTRLEIEQQIEQKRDEVAVLVVVAFLGVLALVFGLTAAALGLGAWLGHPAWGFLIITILLLLIAGLLWYAKGPRRRASKEVVLPPAEQAAPLD